MNNDNRNEEEAVSPVIATILMVAITVVLAGVLYVWASSLAGDSTGGGLDTFQWSDRDAAGDITATGGDDLVHVKMMQGASLSWALLEVSIVVDGGTMNNCVEAADADEDGLKCTYTFVDDKNWDVSEEITISEGANSDLCDGAAGYCNVDVTLSKKAVGDSDGGVIGEFQATAA
jgi:flagellin-like protein